MFQSSMFKTHITNVVPVPVLTVSGFPVDDIAVCCSKTIKFSFIISSIYKALQYRVNETLLADFCHYTS